MKYGLIAGNGRFPFLVVEGAKKAGASLSVVAIKEETDKSIEARLLPGLSFRGTGPLRPNEPTHDGSGEIGAAFLFTALGFVCCPAVSLVGIVFAIKARERNHRLSDTALAVSILGFAGAMVFQSWLYRKVMGG